MTDESIPRRENGKGKAPGTGPRLACLRNCRGEAKGEEVAEGVPGSCAARAKVLRQRVSSALGNYSQHCRLALVMWMEPLREAQRKVLTVLPSANLQSNGSNRINELETGFRHKPSPRTRTCYCAYSTQRMCLLAKGWAVTIKS